MFVFSGFVSFGIVMRVFVSLDDEAEAWREVGVLIAYDKHIQRQGVKGVLHDRRILAIRKVEALVADFFLIFWSLNEIITRFVSDYSKTAQTLN